MVVDPLTTLKISLGLLNILKSGVGEIAKTKKKYEDYGKTVENIERSLGRHEQNLSKWKSEWEIGVGKPGEGTRYFGNDWGRVQDLLTDVDSSSLKLLILFAPFCPDPNVAKTDKKPKLGIRKLRKSPPPELEAARDFLEKMNPDQRQRLENRDERVADADKAAFKKKIKLAMSEKAEKMETLIIQLGNELEALWNASNRAFVQCHTNLSLSLSLDERQCRVEEAWDIDYTIKFGQKAPLLAEVFPETEILPMGNVGLDLGGHRRPALPANENYTFIVNATEQNSSFEIVLGVLDATEPEHGDSVELRDVLLSISESSERYVHIVDQEIPPAAKHRFSMKSQDLGYHEMLDLAKILPPHEKWLPLDDIWDVAVDILDAGLLLFGTSWTMSHQNLRILEKDEKQLSRCFFDFRVSANLEDLVLDRLQKPWTRNEQIKLQACNIGALLLELALRKKVSSIDSSDENPSLTMSDGDKKNLNDYISSASEKLGDTYGEVIRSVFSKMNLPNDPSDDAIKYLQRKEWLGNFYRSTLQVYELICLSHRTYRLTLHYRLKKKRDERRKIVEEARSKVNNT